MLSVSSSSRHAGSSPVSRSDLLHDRAHSFGSRELARRQVHRQRHGAPRRAASAGSARQASRSTHSPIATISPLSSASGMNSPAATRPRSGCCQRTQRLERRRCARSRVDDRLVVAAQLVLARARGAGRSRARARRDAAWFISRGEELVVGAPELLGVVHRGVGVADQRLGVAPVVGEDRDADRGLTCSSRSSTANGWRQLLEHLLRRRSRASAGRSARAAPPRTRRRRCGRWCRRRAAASTRRCATSFSSTSPSAWPSESLTA